MNDKIVTQIGSLPHYSVKESIEYSLKHDIPFLPELSAKEETMFKYIEKPGSLSCLNDFKTVTKGYDLVKVQCVGPATLIQNGYSEDNAVEKAYNHIYEILDNLNAKNIILFLDEPALGHAGFDYQSLWDLLFESFKDTANITSGVHVCGDMDWDRLFESNIDIISYDASNDDITKFPKYRSDKQIAWGINSKENVKDFQKGDLITLPCGMSHKLFSPKDAEVNLEMLLDVAKRLRK